jgi:hypothetical protein
VAQREALHAKRKAGDGVLGIKLLLLAVQHALAIKLCRLLALLEADLAICLGQCLHLQLQAVVQRLEVALQTLLVLRHVGLSALLEALCVCLVLEDLKLPKLLHLLRTPGLVLLHLLLKELDYLRVLLRLKHGQLHHLRVLPRLPVLALFMLLCAQVLQDLQLHRHKLLLAALVLALAPQRAHLLQRRLWGWLVWDPLGALLARQRGCV